MTIVPLVCTSPSKISEPPKVTVPVLPGPMGSSSSVKYMKSSNPTGRIVVYTSLSMVTSVPAGVRYSATPVDQAMYTLSVVPGISFVVQAISLYVPIGSPNSSVPYSTPSCKINVSPAIKGKTTTPTLFNPASAA